MKAKNGGLNAAIRLYKQTRSRDLARNILLLEIGVTGEAALKLMNRLDSLDQAIVWHHHSSNNYTDLTGARNELYKLIEDGAK